jgi:hypothetical protein
VEWIQLAQDSDRCSVVVNTVMNTRILAPRSYLLSYRDRSYVWRAANAFCSDDSSVDSFVADFSAT